jgi:hypothetical protein
MCKKNRTRVVRDPQYTRYDFDTVVLDMATKMQPYNQIRQENEFNCSIIELSLPDAQAARRLAISIGTTLREAIGKRA